VREGLRNAVAFVRRIETESSPGTL
jgi:hypothetical protein